MSFQERVHTLETFSSLHLWIQLTDEDPLELFIHYVFHTQYTVFQYDDL